MGSFQPITRIAIVGAGPIGVAFAKYLLAEKAFKQIDIFEQRSKVGGVWNFSDADCSQNIPIPQLDPRYGARPRVRNGREIEEAERIHDELEFESPLYDDLEANIPKTTMQYSDTPFPDDAPLYPSHGAVLRYLEGYASDVKSLIRFDTQVQDIQTAEDSTGAHKLWTIATKNMKTGDARTAVYDAIVASSGHYTVPQVPDIKGLAAWSRAYPGRVLHSKAYRRPESYQGQRVLVIGNSASGLDIGMQISRHSSRTYLSSKSVSLFSNTQNSMWESIDEVEEFLDPADHDRAVKTKSGKIISAFDRVLFATGYFFSFPYLSHLEPPLITDGLRVRDTYKHFLHIEHTEIALPVLNLRIVPFGLAENQAAVVARLWSGRLPMPSQAEMRTWELARMNEKGDGKQFHQQSFPQDALQMNELYQWAASATPVPGLENDGRGKLGPFWDERAVWLRSNFAAMKAAYAALGENRTKVRTIEELGYVYEAWLRQSKLPDREMFRQAGCAVTSDRFT